ncbi:MAG: Stk1 family PASTA domain-containing Ser/Thr kinase [Lachnospiraceae bacterium]|nr:Stk1 family PASTA domain-containing Ser/Thr kinase [Lachnospiraceae bacterium]
MLEFGTFLGDRYEILELIGSGGMADVYKAKCHKLNRFVAIKVLKPEFSSDSGFVSKFKAEAQAAAGLMHPNIVNVYDVGEERRMYYFVMELVEGITLKHYIEKKIRLTAKEAVSIAIQVSMGIEAAHNNGIIHRDIKPQNIIISKEGKVKVADFGIAKAATSNTVTSHAMGSVHYTSPEQARGGYSDAKSDIYSIGITLFEMITGHVPFDGETTVAVAIKHIQEEMPSPRVYVPDVPISVEQIIAKCCQKNPDRRYANVGQLIRDLKHSLTNPDEEFVVFNEPASEGGTKNISESEKMQIRKQTSAPIPAIAEENIAPPRKPAQYENDMEPGLDDDDDFEDVFGISNKKQPKAERSAPAREPSKKRESRDPRDARDVKQKSRKGDPPAKKQNSYRVREDDYYDDDGLDDDVDPKMEKAVTILLVVAAIIITIIAIVVIGKVFGMFSGSSGDDEEELKIETSAGTTIVPNVVGMSVAEASDALTKAGLTAKATYSESTEYDKDYIVSQDIAGNTEVESGTVLNLVVSSGKVVGVTVPDVVGYTEAEAKVMLDNEGFAMQKQLQESDSVEKGMVISQNPLGATTAAKGSQVTVVISSGKNIEQITMPDLVGKTEEEAKVLIDEEGLSIGTVAEEDSDTVDKGKVISQAPAAGGMVDKGTAVDLKVSLGKKIKTYSCSVDVGSPANFMEGSEAVIVLMSPAGEELGRFSTTTFPYTVSKSGISDISAGIVTITYLSAEGTWETTNPVAVTFTEEAE